MSEVASSANRFGFELLKELLNEDKDNVNSILVSPLSLSVALAAIASGASGDTLSELEELLHLKKLDSTKYQQLLSDFQKQSPSTLSLATGVWLDDRFDIKGDYLNQLADFSATASNMGKNPAGDINKFVAKLTHDRIKDILDEVAADVLLVLVNCIYFKGSWKNPFSKQNTVSADFTLSNGSTRKCDLMSQKHEFDYYENDTLQAINIPYDERFVASVVLPKKSGKDALYDTIKSLSSNWEQVYESFRLETVQLSLPRFKLNYKRSLVPILQSLGLKSATSSSADFSKMTTNAGVFLHQVIHETAIEVNEEGTEASAASVVEMARGLPTSLRVDRAFIFIIRDKVSGGLLFVGVIDDFESSSSNGDKSPERKKRAASRSRSRSRSNGRSKSRSPRRRSRSPKRRRSPSPRERAPRFGAKEDREKTSSLFIGNLDSRLRERDVQDLFEKYGKISSISTSVNKQGLGYAFLTFENRADAEQAYEKMNGQSIEGKTLRVDWDVGLDKKRDTVYRSRGGRGRGRGGRRYSPRRGYSPRRYRSRSPRRYRSPGRYRRSPSPRRRRSRSPRSRRSPSPRRRSRSRSPRSPSPKRYRS